LRTLRDIQIPGRLKLCVSSRSPGELAVEFGQCPNKLLLEELNYFDIKQFVSASIEELDRVQEETDVLTSSITGRAEGVFLWAVLVTGSVCAENWAETDLFELHRVIDETPAEVEEVFQQMLARVKPRHKVDVAFYLQVANLFPGFDHVNELAHLGILTAATGEPEWDSYDDFAQMCKEQRNGSVDSAVGCLVLKRVTTRLGWNPGWMQCSRAWYHECPTTPRSQWAGNGKLR
jgi:hypothetical protein